MSGPPARLAGGELGTTRLAVLIAAAAVLALHSVLRHGFLIVTFDDGPFVSENPLLVEWSWSAVWSCISQFYFHDYVPLPLLTYLIEYQAWGLRPAGYHLTNLLLHIVTSILVAVGCRRAFSQVADERCGFDPRYAGLWAGMIFALHPLQLEVVSLIAQRKTVMATLFAVASLLAYQRASADSARSLAYSVFWYACACASKSSVVPFPLLLVVYDWYFGRGRVRLANKLPFVLLAVLTALLSVLSKADVAIKAPQGGSYLSTALVMSRVIWEYGLAMLVPIGLSPSYYYAPQSSASPANVLALAALAAALVALVVFRKRLPLTAFAVAWVGISLLPVANLVPIAVLRADRYLYLPMVGFAVWGGAGLARLAAAASAGWWRQLGRAAPIAVCALLGLLSWRGAAVWQNDVTAWNRVVDLHPWNARARYLLGLAYADAEQWSASQQELQRSISIDAEFAPPHQVLANVYRQLGDAAGAAHHQQRWSELVDEAARRPSER